MRGAHLARRRASGRDAVPERRSAKTRLVNLQPQKMPAVFQPGSQERRHICQMFHGRRRAASARNAKLTPPRWRRGEPLGVGHERSLPTGAMLARPHSLSVRPPTLERWWCAGCCGKLGVGKTQPELCSHPENYGHRSPEPAKAVRPIATRSKRLPARRFYREPSAVCWSSHFLSLKRLRSEAAICRRSLRSGPRGNKRAYWSIWRRN